jgi:hypothetical protein
MPQATRGKELLPYREVWSLEVYWPLCGVNSAAASPRRNSILKHLLNGRQG